MREASLSKLRSKYQFRDSLSSSDHQKQSLRKENRDLPLFNSTNQNIFNTKNIALKNLEIIRKGRSNELKLCNINGVRLINKI